jgi:hypothetical protein
MSTIGYVAVEASFSGLLRVIFWILVVSAAIRLIAYLATPYVVRKAEETLRSRMQNQQRPQDHRKEGDVIVEPTKKKQNPDKGGDYVDYIEIKD